VLDEAVTVSVELDVEVPLIETEAGLRLHPGLVGFEREEVTAHVSETVPVNEFDGVTLMVELPVVEPAAMVMFPLLLRLKSVLVPLPGACQKSPQPVKTGAAASNNPAQDPIFITAPLTPYSGYAVFWNSLTGYRLGARPVLPSRSILARTPASCQKRRSPAKIRLSLPPGSSSSAPG
jgi:hypothetical protein